MQSPFSQSFMGGGLLVFVHLIGTRLSTQIWKAELLEEEKTLKNKRIYLNAFEINCVGHQSPWSVGHTQKIGHINIKTSKYWIELAKVLEKGRFDAIFLADVLGTYDVYKGSRDAAVRQWNAISSKRSSISCSDHVSWWQNILVLGWQLPSAMNIHTHLQGEYRHLII